MRTSLALLVGSLSVVASTSCGWTARGFATTETLTGEVIDLVCYGRYQEKGMDHGPNRTMCAWACVKWEGQPVGLLTREGKVYQFAGDLVANNNARIAPFVAQTVTVTGEVYELDGMPMIAASDVKATTSQ